MTSALLRDGAKSILIDPVSAALTLTLSRSLWFSGRCLWLAIPCGPAARAVASRLAGGACRWQDLPSGVRLICHAEIRMFDLRFIALIAAIAVFVAAEIVLVTSTLTQLRRPRHVSDTAQVNPWIELIWVVTPGVLLAALVVLLISTR